MEEAIAIGLPAAERRRDLGASSFETLVVRERPRLVAIAERILRDRNAAEDVAQDALTSFARRYGTDAPFASSWLRTAAAHGAYDVLRRERRRRSRETCEHLLSQAVRDGAALEANPAAHIERCEDRALVRTALVRIGQRHATVLALRYGGLSYAQIAAALRITIGSVGTRLARAESALAKELRK